jgi:hypothetical protein
MCNSDSKVIDESESPLFETGFFQVIGPLYLSGSEFIEIIFGKSGIVVLFCTRYLWGK